MNQWQSVLTHKGLDITYRIAHTTAHDTGLQLDTMGQAQFRGLQILIIQKGRQSQCFHMSKSCRF